MSLPEKYLEWVSNLCTKSSAEVNDHNPQSPGADGTGETPSPKRAPSSWHRRDAADLGDWLQNFPRNKIRAPPCSSPSSRCPRRAQLMLGMARRSRSCHPSASTSHHTRDQFLRSVGAAAVLTRSCKNFSGSQQLSAPFRASREHRVFPLYLSIHLQLVLIFFFPQKNPHHSVPFHTMLT